MAYSDSGDSVRKTAGTIATVWIIVIVVLVVLSVAGCIVAVWMWRRHVRRRRQRMDAFYATPIQNGPPAAAIPQLQLPAGAAKTRTTTTTTTPGVRDIHAQFTTTATGGGAIGRAAHRGRQH
ncbi:hypothetical protein PG990_007011 [Apiospora arundinis]